MGCFDFRPMRVHQAVTQLLRTERIRTPPVWHDVVGAITPSTILVRTQPVKHVKQARPGKRPRKAKGKASRLFQPLPIVYPEDKLRKTFFQDHPWELARPRMVLEDDGKDSQRTDWSRLRQESRPLDGESAVQRQLYLMNSPLLSNGQPLFEPLSEEDAYDQARKEFYHLRLQEDVERRVGREEAQMTGAYFGMSNLEIGMQLEDQEHEKWKEDSFKAMEAQRLRQGAHSSTVPVLSEGEDATLAETIEEPPVDEQTGPAEDEID